MKIILVWIMEVESLKASGRQILSELVYTRVQLSRGGWTVEHIQPRKEKYIYLRRKLYYYRVLYYVSRFQDISPKCVSVCLSLFYTLCLKHTGLWTATWAHDIIELLNKSRYKFMNLWYNIRAANCREIFFFNSIFYESLI